jgi:protein HOOK3
MEIQMQELLDKNKALEEHFEKIAGFKDLIETYKKQIVSLEDKNALLNMESMDLKIQLGQLKDEIAELKREKSTYEERNGHLLNRIKELESMQASNNTSVEAYNYSNSARHRWILLEKN